MNVGNQSGEEVIYVADNGGPPGGEDAIAKPLATGEWCSPRGSVCSGQLSHGESHFNKLTTSQSTIAVEFHDSTGSNLLAARDNLLPTATAVLMQPAPGVYEIQVF